MKKILSQILQLVSELIEQQNRMEREIHTIKYSILENHNGISENQKLLLDLSECAGLVTSTTSIEEEKKDEEIK